MPFLDAFSAAAFAQMQKQIKIAPIRKRKMSIVQDKRASGELPGSVIVNTEFPAESILAPYSSWAFQGLLRKALETQAISRENPSVIPG
jgi:hypothetical protein